MGVQKGSKLNRLERALPEGLLMWTLPYVAEESCFALKGGTVITGAHKYLRG